MSTGENIRNSIQVLYKTYESVSKMMEQCKAIAEDSGYIHMSDKFLRWKSDSNSDGWLLNSFILVFQRISDPECESGNHWRNAPVYTMEICLGIKSDPDRLPELLMSKFEYRNIGDWAEGCSPADHWGFHQPVHQGRAKQFSVRQEEDFSIYIPNSSKVSETYWDLERVVSVTSPLISVTSANLQDVVFGTFDRLMEYNTDKTHS